MRIMESKLYFKDPMIFDEYKIYIDNDSLELCDSSCFKCKKEYYNINFTGNVEEEGEKVPIYGSFSGSDSNCVCPPYPDSECVLMDNHMNGCECENYFNQVLCKINREEEKFDSWQFLHYYVDDDLAKKLIPMLKK